ncbi:Uma2 family endonuclease [Actinoallomurus sp. CA-150999]|uniref:Uma2 family endonuclease n=1 Tax=Actinoallomurus sp. CA-150999 TaxID=3239887 RepID=UPI003D92DE5B
MTEAFAMPPDHYRTSWTIEEVLALPDNGMRHELLEGRLVVSPVPPPTHQNAGQRLIRLLYAAVSVEYEVTPETNVRVGPDLFIPDVIVAKSEALCVLERQYVDPKDILLVAETLSPGNTGFERAWKPQRYADGGIPYYLELELHGIPRVRVYKLRGTGYVEMADAHAGETLKLAEPFELSFDPAELLGRRR